MSFSPEFDALRELRREDDPTLSQGEWVTELKRADWPGLQAACEDLLAHKTKDLRVAGWYTEAAGKLRGYAGLADGVELVGGLCERFWEPLHPRIDAGDSDLRVGSLQWLLGQLPQWCRAAVLAPKAALSLAVIEASRQARSEEGAPGPEDAARALRAIPPAELLATLDNARRLQDALHALQRVVDGHMGADGPAFASARDAVERAVHAIERLAKESGALSTPADAAPAADDAPAHAPAFGAAPTSRAQALGQLRLVAEFFRRTEPHSPVAYLAERAAHWGEMPLHVWLRAVMKEGGTLAQLEELLGVDPQTSA
jgi:type VI secretion system protein ImpA